MNAIKSELNSFFNGSEGKGSQDSKGNQVQFKFNISPITDVGQNKKTLTDISNANSISGTQTEYGSTVDVSAPAVIFTNQFSGGHMGKTNGQLIQMGNVQGEGWYAHELMHTFGINDNGYASGGLLNSPPETISPNEVDQVLNNSYDKK